MANNKPHTQEAKDKIRDGLKGKKKSLETKKKMSEQKIGDKNPTFGKTRSEETKAKISQSMKSKGTGEDNSMAKLTNTQRESIRSLHKDLGLTVLMLAIEFNVSERTIERVLEDK